MSEWDRSAVSEQASPPVLAGERLPFCFGMTADRRFYSSEEQAGRPAVMIAVHHASPDEVRPVIRAFIQRSEAFAACGADVLLLASADVVRRVTDDLPAPCPVQIIDCDMHFLARCRIRSGTVALVVDRNLRVALRLSTGDVVDLVSACLECLAGMPREEARDVLLPAPVLSLPHLLDRALCRTLIERFESGPSIDGGVAAIDAAGVPQNRVDVGKKRRRDSLISPSDPLHTILQEALLRRCAPEIARAFQVKVRHTDRILVARYDDSGGWFRRHRDNGAENVAFREFALSVNLNTDYDGGHLLFPEYNDHRYRPPSGGGIIFSASLLHEATPVLRGRRYVLLTFLHGDAAEERRLAYLARATGDR